LLNFFFVAVKRETNQEMKNSLSSNTFHVYHTAYVYNTDDLYSGKNNVNEKRHSEDKRMSSLYSEVDTVQTRCFDCCV